MVGGMPTGVIEPSLPPAVGLLWLCSRLEAKCPDCQPPLSRADLPVNSEANGSLNDTAGILTRFALSWAPLPVFGRAGCELPRASQEITVHPPETAKAWILQETNFTGSLTQCEHRK